MIVFLTLCYVALLAALVWLKILPNTLWTWLSTIVWTVLLFVVLFIPMQWGAPAGPARIMTYTVQIIPNVAGPVVEVPVEANRPIKKGDVLFTIDPTTYEAALQATQAQLNFQELRLEQYEKLASTAAGTRFQVEETEARVKQLTAELQAAEWNLNETTVRAPADGYVTYVALRPGQRVVTFPFQPAMTFVDTSRKIVAVQIQQIYQRHLERGQDVEIAFKTRPGRIYTGKVEAVLPRDPRKPGGDQRDSPCRRAHPSRALLCARPTRRSGNGQGPTGRNRRHGRDLYKKRRHDPHCPEGHDPNGVLHELHHSLALSGTSLSAAPPLSVRFQSYFAQKGMRPIAPSRRQDSSLTTAPLECRADSKENLNKRPDHVRGVSLQS